MEHPSFSLCKAKTYSSKAQYEAPLYFFSFFFRKKSSRLTRLDRLTLPSLIALMTCLAWPTLMMLVSCGTQSSGTRMSSSTPTPVFSVLPSTPTSGSPSTLSAPWKSTLESEGDSLSYLLALLLHDSLIFCGFNQINLSKNIYLIEIKSHWRYFY